MARPGFLETLSKRPILGDGSYVHTLEKRGYVAAGCWTPECVIENPEAGQWIIMAYFTNDVNTALAKPPLEFRQDKSKQLALLDDWTSSI